MMHPMPTILTEMVVAATIAAKRAALVPVDPGELERYAQRAVPRFRAERPKLTASLPELALKPVLALLLRRTLPI